MSTFEEVQKKYYELMVPIDPPKLGEFRPTIKMCTIGMEDKMFHRVIVYIDNVSLEEAQKQFKMFQDLFEEMGRPKNESSAN